MSWSTLPPKLRELAEQVCTRKELDVLKLREAGMSWRRIGVSLDIAHSTAFDAAKRGVRRMRKHVLAGELGPLEDLLER